MAHRISASFNRSFCFSSWIYASDVLAFESPSPSGAAKERKYLNPKPNTLHSPPPAFSTPSSTSTRARCSLTSSNSCSANSALSSATSLSNIAISNCSCASTPLVSPKLASCSASANARFVAMSSVCRDWSLAWSLGRRATKDSASARRASSSRMCWASSARLASRTRILARLAESSVR